MSVYGENTSDISMPTMHLPRVELSPKKVDESLRLALKPARKLSDDSEDTNHQPHYNLESSKKKETTQRNSIDRNIMRQTLLNF